nr:hypothetical protein [Tanacetum cinerariifolium]
MMVQAQEEIGEDEAIIKEMDDSLERAATTATSLDAEQDTSNTFKTQSKATPNEPGSQGTSSGGGPRCQETMRDTISQTRSERVSKISNDPLLIVVNTPQSGEDARVESSEDEGLGEEDASKQGRIADIDANEDNYLVNVYNGEDMFGVNNLDGDEVIVESVDVAEQAKEVVDDITLAKALIEIITASSRPKAKGLVIHEQEQAPTPTVSSQQPSQAKIDVDYQLAQRLQAEEAEEKRNRPTTKAQQRSIMCTYLKNMDGWKLKSLKKKSFAKIQELFDKAMEKVNTFINFRTELVEESSKKAEAEITQEGSLKRVGDELKQERSKKHNVEDDKESKELKKCLEIIPDDEDDVTIDATPLSFNKMPKNFDREDLEVLWRLVKARFEKMYPLTNHTLHQMFNDVKLQVDYECEMAFDLLRLVKKQLKEGYVPPMKYLEASS